MEAELTLPAPRSWIQTIKINIHITPLIKARNPRARMRKIHLTSEEADCATFHAITAHSSSVNCNITSVCITDITHTQYITANFSSRSRHRSTHRPLSAPDGGRVHTVEGRAQAAAGSWPAVNTLVLLHITCTLQIGVNSTRHIKVNVFDSKEVQKYLDLDVLIATFLLFSRKNI